MHRYQTYSGSDYRGNECMRQAFEPLYYQYGVDVQFNGTPPHSTCVLPPTSWYSTLVSNHKWRPSHSKGPLVLAGHVHAYERSFPVNNYNVDPCGTTHILIGDGGNAGGVRLEPD